MYSAGLALHSWIRWAVILLGMLAIARAVAARGGRWTPAADRAGLLFTVAFDVQFIVGLVLYFVLSPLTRNAMQHMDVAMQTAPIRYWAVEHPVGMLIALILAHVGRVRVRRAAEANKPRNAIIFFAIALLIVVALTPWPNMPGERPLFRLP